MKFTDLAERHRAHGALAVPSRVRLLDVLRAATLPLTAQELAAAGGLHVSTVRFHLEVLADAGLVHGRSEPTGRRGRPRMVFSPATAGRPSTPAGHAGYELLAGVLAAHWADSPAERAERAEHAGHAAAQRRTHAGDGDRVRPAMTMAESVAEVTGVFAELGFEPDVVADGEGLQIRLHACPFRAVAVEHPEVVCSLHLGLIRGSLADMGAPAVASRLEPFVEPYLCIAHIAPAPVDPPTAAAS